MHQNVSTVARNPVLITSPRALLASLFSFEALLLLYVFAGLYKGDPRIAWVPVDLTGLFFALSVLVGSFILVLGRLYKNGVYIIVAAVAFIAWFWLSLLWSPSRIYGPEKVFHLGTLALWALVAGAMIVAPDPARVRRFFTLLVVFSMWVAIETIVAGEVAGRLATELELGTYLARGRVCGLGAVAVFVAWLFGRRGSMLNVVLLPLFLWLVFVLAIGGGRGPLLASALSLLVPLVGGLRLTRHQILYSRYQLSLLGLAAVVVGFFVSYTVITGEVPKTFDRLEEMVQANEFRGSASARVEHYATAVELWSQAPMVGHGAGGWSIEARGADVAHYPHNMFLEVLVEGGLIALILLLMLFATALRPVSMARLRSDPLALCSLMLFANAFLNAMFSGDLPDNRAMFMLLGLLTLFTIHRPAAKAEYAKPLATDWRVPAYHSAGEKPL